MKGLLESEEFEESNLFDEHIKVRDALGLAHYVGTMLGDQAAIENYNEREIFGFYKNAEFSIAFYGGDFLMLKVEDGADKEEIEIKRILKPVMWGITSGRTDVFSDEILSYSVGDDGGVPGSCFNVTIWDFANPMATIDAFLDDIAKGKIFAYNVVSKYMGISGEKLFEKIFYGTYSNFLSQERINEINNYSEFELFFTLKSVSKELQTLEANVVKARKTPIEHEESTAQRRLYNYFFQYLVQQTKRFGVKVNKPSITPPEPTEEFECWMKWWGEAFEKLLEAKPNVLEEWKVYENGYDENFRPEIPFNEFYKMYLVQKQAEAKRKQEEFLRAQKEQEEADKLRRKTLGGRVTSLFDAIKDEAEKIVDENNNQINPFGNFE